MSSSPRKSIEHAQMYEEQYDRPFPKLGITMAGILAFIADVGGKEELDGKSTTEVCEEFIKTRTTSKSYCDQLYHEGNHDGFIQEGNVFVSHAWKYAFLSVVEAMESYRPKNNKPEITVFWFDLFSNNQHGLNKPPPFEWWCKTFMGAIKDIGTIVMVIEPWHDPITLTRSWCLWEIYCCSKSESKFDIAMSAEQQKSFEELMCNDESIFWTCLVASTSNEARRGTRWIRTRSTMLSSVLTEDTKH